MLECGLRAVVLHDKGVVWNYYAECTADSRRINTKMKISLESPDNWNDLWTESNTPFAFYSVTNAGKATGSPKECYAFGLLIVFTADISTYYSGWRNIQIYIEDSSNGNSDRGRIYIRSNNRDNTGWKLFTGSKIDLA